MYGHFRYTGILPYHRCLRTLNFPLNGFFVSQGSTHVKAVVVEVNEGERSVLLPCQYSGFIPDDDPTVMWTRSDLHPKSVHLHREGGDDLRGQNQRYSGRTSMKPDALDTGDFSLTLRKPTKTDSGNYTCSISDGREERRLTDIQLQVKGQQQTKTPAIITGQRSVRPLGGLEPSHGVCSLCGVSE
uniref:Ig-like domain-containing protein n=1 Tax=Oreochromis niloticus TaxID=8128 RepID=A0A669BSR3_ORENI